MKELKCFVRDIQAEYEDAEHYAGLALRHKESDTQLADVYYRLAGQEIDHADMLQNQAARVIRAKQDRMMTEIWDWEREKMIECQEKVKRLLDLYRK